MDCVSWPRVLTGKATSSCPWSLSDLAISGDVGAGTDKLHRPHKQTGNRIKYKKVDAETGREVEADVIKGYEVSKGEYIELEQEQLEGGKVAATIGTDQRRTAGHIIAPPRRRVVPH